VCVSVRRLNQRLFEGIRKPKPGVLLYAIKKRPLPKLVLGRLCLRVKHDQYGLLLYHTDTAHPGQYTRNFGAVSSIRTVLDPKFAQESDPNPGSEPRRVQRLWTKTARKVQSVEQSGRRPAGCWLAMQSGVNLSGIHIMKIKKSDSARITLHGAWLDAPGCP
jgi:hypothetical protein